MTTASRPIVRALFPGLLLGFLVILILVLMGDFRRVEIHFLSFKWQFFLFALGLEIINRTVKFLKHAFYLEQTGVRSISFPRKINLFLSEYPLSATSPSFGESYKSIWLSKTSGIPINQADSIYLLDRISDALSVLVLATIGVFAFPSMWPLFLIFFTLFLIGTITLKVKPAIHKSIGFGDRLAKFQGFTQELRGVIEGNPRAFTSMSIAVSFSLGLLSWLAHAAALFFILIGTGLSPNLALISTSCLVLSFSMLMGMLSRLPGGLGVFELAMAALLTILLNFNPGLAVTTTILFRLATFWISLLFGILFWSVAGQTPGLNTGARHSAKG